VPLVVIDGPDGQQRIPLAGELVIGREDSVVSEDVLTLGRTSVTVEGAREVDPSATIVRHEP
jgi:hypothetical protein